MRRLALLLPFIVLASCAPAPGAGEHAARVEQRFTSNESVLVDFDFDGSIVADTDDVATLKTLIGAQLLYSVGSLNADRSVGRHERLELSAIARAPTGEVTYHARLPVAWGRRDAIPTSYRLVLPARAGESDQTAFAAKYGETCADPEGGAGPVHPARMFLFYRPLRPGCVLGTDDVVTLSAKVSPSSENTTGKYPEYDRIWEDGALRVVALFSRAEALETTGSDDEGVHAFYGFMTRALSFGRSLGPSAITSRGGADGWSLAATLVDGRKLFIDARVVGHELANEPPAFDAWYDARTPAADLVMYSGHAGLGWNVRTLMTKGSFRARQYLIWSVNGCDTFAYVDRTLAKRRALLNPDDPGGTKYMDVVSNVMAASFVTGPGTTLGLIDALLGRTKTYRDIFAGVDPAQVIAVTGEEDNAFAPKPETNPPPPPPSASWPAVEQEPNDDEPPSSAEDLTPEERSFGACAAAPLSERLDEGNGAALFFAVAFAAFSARRRVSRAP